MGRPWYRASFDGHSSEMKANYDAGVRASQSIQLFTLLCVYFQLSGARKGRFLSSTEKAWNIPILCEVSKTIFENESRGSSMTEMAIKVYLLKPSCIILEPRSIFSLVLHHQVNLNNNPQKIDLRPRPHLTSGADADCLLRERQSESSWGICRDEAEDGAVPQPAYSQHERLVCGSTDLWNTKRMRW